MSWQRERGNEATSRKKRARKSLQKRKGNEGTQTRFTHPERVFTAEGLNPGMANLTKRENPVDRGDLAWIKNILEAKRSRILSRAQIDIREGAEDHRENLDEIDLANVGEELDSRCSLHERNLGLFWQIEEALRKIETGAFGFCEECDEPIHAERLKAHPTATLCIDCKQYQEETERRDASRRVILPKSLFFDRD